VSPSGSAPASFSSTQWWKDRTAHQRLRVPWPCAAKEALVHNGQGFANKPGQKGSPFPQPALIRVLFSTKTRQSPHHRADKMQTCGEIEATVWPARHGDMRASCHHSLASLEGQTTSAVAEGRKQREVFKRKYRG
jgi:hypothetical protein